MWSVGIGTIGYSSAEVLPPVSMLSTKHHVLEDGMTLAPRSVLSSVGRMPEDLPGEICLMNELPRSALAKVPPREVRHYLLEAYEQ